MSESRPQKKKTTQKLQKNETVKISQITKTRRRYKLRSERKPGLTDGVAQTLSVKSPGQKLTLHQSANLHLRT